MTGRLALVVLLMVAVAGLALAALTLPPPEQFGRPHVFEVASL
jgi:hypothetical protein